MGSLLLAWELGEGLGHLTKLEPIAEHFLAAGHQAHLVVRELTAAETVFGGMSVSLYQSPIKIGPPIAPVAEPISYAQLLHNCGFETVREIVARLKAWDQLLDLIQPRLVVCDHCPTLLAAKRGRDFRIASIGTGFVNPPNGDQMPSLMPWRKVSTRLLHDSEQPTLMTTNAALAAVGKPTLARMSDLYADVDCTLINSFKELDHFGQRPGFRYSGAWPRRGGDRPEWPPSTGENTKRLFAYLKRSPGLTELLERLGKCGHAVLVYGDWTTDEVCRLHATPTMRLLQRPVDLLTVAEQCDLAILNGTHGATAAMLLGGAPILQLPIYLEQRLVSERVVVLGAGCVADRTDPVAVMKRIESMLANPSFAQGARKFAESYKNVNPTKQFEFMIQQLDALI